ncbi:hypothetical protein ACHAXS_004044 [Conticribra weissflogii]
MAKNGRENEEGATAAGGDAPPNYGAIGALPPAGALPPSPRPASHLSTYTAGEDAGRLATLAKEFGLSKVRPPRHQIRERIPEELSSLNLSSLKKWYESVKRMDEDFLEMRVQSVYVREHGEESTLGSYRTEEADEEEEEGAEEGLLLSSKAAAKKKLEQELDEEELELEEEDEQDASSATDDPHATQMGGTLPSAILGIIKGMVGPAILYLPHGFASAGYLVAVPLLLLSTVLFLWSATCLLQAWRMETLRLYRERKNTKTLSLKIQRIRLSYPELAYRSFGTKGETLVQVGISLMQSGVCLTYLIFVPQNLHSSALDLFGANISTSWWLAFMMAVQIPMSWIRDIRRLTVTNLLANALILYGLLTCLGFALKQMGGSEVDVDVGEEGLDGVGYDYANSAEDPVGGTGPKIVGVVIDDGDNDERTFFREVLFRFRSLPPFNPAGWFLFMGTSVLLFEGSITLLIPLQEAVQRTSDRRKFPSLYKKVILGIVAFYSFFGITCWMAFGNGVRTVMTTSLPAGQLATSVQLAYSLAVVFTFPLQNFPSLEIVCRAVEKWLAKKGLDGGVHYGGNCTKSKIISQQRNIISTLLVICLSVIAVTCMNDLDKVVSLMGSLLGCPLAFVVPPLIHNRLGKSRIGKWKRVGNWIVAGLGVAAMAVSSIATVMKWE